MSKNPTYGILVHKFPQDNMQYVYVIFEQKTVDKTISDDTGLKLYFKTYETAWKFILAKRVVVRGEVYEIYPLVTNLTVHGIRHYASESHVSDHMLFYGPVINVYTVLNTTKHDNYERKSETDNYRVLLNVPEVQANFPLTPLSVNGLGFLITFFCRRCRQDGHKQHECTDNLNKHFFNRADSSSSTASINNRFEYSSDRIKMVSVQPKISETEVSTSVDNTPYPDQHCDGSYWRTLEPNESENFFSSSGEAEGDNCCPQLYDEYHTSNNRQIKDFDINSSSLKVQGNVKYPKNKSRCQQEFKSANFENKKPSRDQESFRKIQNRPLNKSVTDVNQIPVIMNRNIVTKYYSKDGEKQTKEIPHTGSRVGANVENLKTTKKLGHEAAERTGGRDSIASAIERVITATKDESHKSSRAENQTSTKCKNTRKRSSLSSGIKLAIRKVRGEINAADLITFLEEVRGKKNIANIMSDFHIRDIKAFVKQLKEVERVFYKSGYRGNDEDNDVKRVKNLYLKLEKDNYKGEQVIAKKKEENFTSAVPNIQMKIENDF